MSTEIIILIIGAFLGAILTFFAGRIEKNFELKKGKKIAIICLNIDLRGIYSYINALLKTKESENITVPNTDIPEIELASQTQHFIYYEEILAEQVYDLTKYLRSANEHRILAFDLIEKQSNPEFMKNDKMFWMECKEIKKMLDQLNNSIHFLGE